MLWHQGDQNIGLSNRKLKSVRSQCMLISDRQADGQTDEHHGNSATIRFDERIAC